jgi:hypothetical protein
LPSQVGDLETAWEISYAITFLALCQPLQLLQLANLGLNKGFPSPHSVMPIETTLQLVLVWEGASLMWLPEDFCDNPSHGLEESNMQSTGIIKYKLSKHMLVFSLSVERQPL